MFRLRAELLGQILAGLIVVTVIVIFGKSTVTVILLGVVAVAVLVGGVLAVRR